jgi:hypothetical protein
MLMVAVMALVMDGLLLESEIYCNVDVFHLEQ